MEALEFPDVPESEVRRTSRAQKGGRADGLANLTTTSCRMGEA